MIAYLEFNRFPQNSVEADSDFRDLQCQLFINIISDSVLFNKDSKFICVSSFPTNFSDTFTKLIVTSMFGRSNQSFPNNDFQLVVKLIVDSSSEGAHKSKLIVDSIPSYEGSQRAASKLIVICAFGLNKLIKLISASRHQQLIVAYVNMNSKICLIFGEECFRTFCAGEWELIGNISPVSFIELVELIGHVGHIISLGGTIVIVDYNGLLDLLVSLNQWLVGCCIIGLVDLLASSNQWLVGLLGFIGHIGLVRRIDLVNNIGFFGHIGLVGRTVSLIGLGLVGLSGLSGISGLIGQISLISWNHWPIGLIGVIGFGHIASSVSAVSSARRPLGVATVRSSATEIANAATISYLITSLFHVHSLAREKMWWWLALARI